MITKGSSSPVTAWRRPCASWGPMVVIMALSALLQLFRDTVFPLLAYQRDGLLAGQVWRLWSGHLLHLGLAHLLLNLGALLAFVWLCPVRWSLAGWALRWLWLGAGVSLGLLIWQPHLHWFVGLSGLLHGLFVLGLWPQARQHERVAQLALVLLAGKLLMEVFTGASVSDEALVGGRVITASHAFGAVSAVIFLLACEALTRLRGAVNVSTPDTSTKHK